MAHPKGLLIERLRKQGAGKPVFDTVNTGPQHQPTFSSEVTVNGESYGRGEGSTKREAERLAAEEALAFLDRNPLALAGEPPAGETAEEHENSEYEDEEYMDDEGFDGPWPIFENLLVASLHVANERTDARLAGEEARAEVRDFTLELYKDLLGNLGEVVEEEEPES